ncbi:hypothetical protein BGX24_004818, partial [Mortierella sp. AD032]
QLQQQLEQARTSISTAAAAAASPATSAVDTATLGAISQQQQQLQQSQLSMVNQGVPLHFALPAAPVLTTAMGMGMGMNMNMGMSSLLGMGVGLQQPGTMMSQLVMTPPLTPQLIGYTTPMYSYQQIPAGVVPAAGGANSARGSVVMGY